MAKEKETENRSERERFLDCMLKEILSGRRNPGDRLPTESELAEQYGLRKTNVHLGLQELERLGFLKVVPRHATYVAPYWEQANLETLAAIMTHGGKPQPELVDAFLELREMVALGWFRWTGRSSGWRPSPTRRTERRIIRNFWIWSISFWCACLPSRTT